MFKIVIDFYRVYLKEEMYLGIVIVIMNLELIFGICLIRNNIFYG